MQLFKSAFNFDFMGKRKLALVVSVVVLLIAAGSIMTRGLNFGIDFTGGTLIEVGYETAISPETIRSALQAQGFDDASVQQFGSAKDILIRLAPKDDLKSSELGDRIFSILRQQATGDIDLRRVEFVGPQVGEELTSDGGLAVLISLMAILVYVALRFEWRFAVGSVIALMHDVLFTLGIFSVLQLDFDLSVLAAVLAVIGYSLNDTIVVYDRIRENFRKMRKGSPTEIINQSLNMTLSRTLMTSITTLLVLLVLFFLGGEIIHGFAMALMVGVLVGTYSSIYIASSSVLMLGISKADLMQVKKEDDKGMGDVV